MITNSSPHPNPLTLKWLWRSLLILALLTLICVTLPVAQATPGDLDTTFAGFGTGGIVTIPNWHGVNVAALAPDGKIVVVGYEGPKLLLRRYLSNGQPDNSFGSNGKAEILFEYVVYVTDVVVQADGKIIVAGFSDRPNSVYQAFLVVRLLSQGDLLDSDFGTRGIIKLTPDGPAAANTVLIQPDGKLVVGGTAKLGGDNDFMVARFTVNGKPDQTFDRDGIATVGFGGEDALSDMVIQPDGRLVLIGTTYGLFVDKDLALARLNPNGSLDNSFDFDGKRSTGFGSNNDRGVAVVVQPDNKIVALGTSENKGVMARYQPDGRLDSSFDGDGKLSISSDSFSDMVIQPDGNLVLIGTHTSPDNDQKVIFQRLTPTGATDGTFADDGRLLIDFGGHDRGWGLTLQADGRILGAAIPEQEAGHSSKALLIRLWPDGTFDTGGRQVFGLDVPGFSAGSDEHSTALAIQRSFDQIIVAGEVTNAAGTESDTILTSFYADGRPDAYFGTNGSFLFGIGQYDAARAIAIQRDYKIVVAGYSDPFGSSPTNFMIARIQKVAGQTVMDGTFGLGGINVMDFAGGADYGHAMALTPDGKFVVAGNVWNGTRSVWGVARFDKNGIPDSSFGPNHDGKVFIDFVQTNSANAVAIQPDGKILVAGHMAQSFAVARLNEDGSTDYTFGPGNQGLSFTDMGGPAEIMALVLAPNGWFYAAGYRQLNGKADFALVQYQANGTPTSCEGDPGCRHWPLGKAFIDWGGPDLAYALDLRADNRLVAAGCANGQFAWAQVRTNGIPNPVKFTTDFAGFNECARAVKFVGNNKVVMAGHQEFSGDQNFALARFETTVDSTSPTPTPTSIPPSTTPTSTPPSTPTPNSSPTGYRQYLPVILR